MSERIDHAAAALAILRDLDSDEAVENRDDARVAALVHSNLALVEQARIANLIALACNAPGTTAGDEAGDALTVRVYSEWPLRPGIAAALGIKTGDKEDEG